MTPRNMKSVFGFARKAFGSRMAATIFQQQGLIKSKSPEEAMKYLNKVADAKLNDDGTYAGADTSALQEAKSRKIAMGDVNKQLMGEELREEMKALSGVAKMAEEFTREWKEFKGEVVTGGRLKVSFESDIDRIDINENISR